MGATDPDGRRKRSSGRTLAAAITLALVAAGCVSGQTETRVGGGVETTVAVEVD